ncbi:MAG: AAA family ATPase [Gemmatimonadetes bacterium]|nr:AAA family ATPase [Gemmatimonadota bacterium]
MIRSVRIANFRSFERVEAKNFGRFNVVVGDNGAGKTAFLEAMFLAAGNSPESVIRVRAWRGLGGPRGTVVSTHDLATGSLFRDLFHRFDERKLISIEIKGPPHRTLTIEGVQRSPKIPVVSDGETKAPVVFKWKDNLGKERSSTPRVTRDGIEFPDVPPGINGAFLTGQVTSIEVAQQFSALDRYNRGAAILHGLQRQFPEVRELSVQLDQALGPMVYATIPYLPEKIPLALLSSGINRIVQVLIAIEHFPKGSLFVDEIENGIYYARMPAVWESLVESVLSSDNQLFVSTHSGEALAALAPLVAQLRDFRLIRISKNSDGQSFARVVDGRDFEAALEERVEVR